MEFLHGAFASNVAQVAARRASCVRADGPTWSHKILSRPILCNQNWELIPPRIGEQYGCRGGSRYVEGGPMCFIDIPGGPYLLY